VGLLCVGTTSFNCPSGPGITNPDAQAVAAAKAHDAAAVASVRSMSGGSDEQGGRSECGRGRGDGVCSLEDVVRPGDEDDEGFIAADAPNEALVDKTPVVPRPMPRPLEPPHMPVATDPPALVMTARNFSIGRYVRCELSGEILYCVSDVHAGNIETISIVWVGPPQGDGGKVRETVSVTCDARLFAAGMLVDSIITSEYTVRVSARFEPGVLPTSPTDLSQNSRNMAPYHGPVDGYIVPRRPRSGRAIDLSHGRQIFSTSLESLPYGAPRGNMLRAKLLEIAVHDRALQPTPLRWAMSPVVEVYLQALERAQAAVDARRLGLRSDDSFFDFTEGAIVDMYDAVTPPASAASGSVSAEASAGVLPSPQSPFSMDPWIVPPLNSRAAAMPFAAGELGRFSFSALVAHPTTAQPLSPVLVNSVTPQQVAPVPVDPATAAAAGAVSFAAAAEHTPAAVPLAPAPRSAPGRLTPAAAAAAEADPVRALQAKRAQRREDNIAAARRSNAKRKAAYEELVCSLELAKELERVLRERERALRDENAWLRDALLGDAAVFIAD
jgi:hypothetical protein